VLFRKLPDLQRHLPMFRDKIPVSLRYDPPRLIARKALRALTAWRPVRWSLERTVSLLERFAPLPSLLQPLYRWTIGSYIYLGYSEGLRLHGPVETAQ
jgi:hypothetical protein